MASLVRPLADPFVRRLRLLLLALLLAAPGTAGAIQIFEESAQPLSALLDDGEIVIGDKRFDDFSYSATGDMPAAGLVNVIPIIDDQGKFGLRFQGGFGDLFSNGSGSDALIGFRVTVLDETRFIVGADLAGNPMLLGDTGSISVVETIDLPPLGSPDVQMAIFDDEGAGTQLSDWVGFDPVKTLRVEKDILAFATADGTVTLSRIDQTFDQIQVPELGALMSLGSGLIGLAVMGRRRR